MSTGNTPFTIETTYIDLDCYNVTRSQPIPYGDGYHGTLDVNESSLTLGINSFFDNQIGLKAQTLGRYCNQFQRQCYAPTDAALPIQDLDL